MTHGAAIAHRALRGPGPRARSLPARLARLQARQRRPDLRQRVPATGWEAQQPHARRAAYGYDTGIARPATRCRAGKPTTASWGVRASRCLHRSTRAIRYGSKPVVVLGFRSGQ